MLGRAAHRDQRPPRATEVNRNVDNINGATGEEARQKARSIVTNAGHK